jgi:hypothetical protein
MTTISASKYNRTENEGTQYRGVPHAFILNTAFTLRAAKDQLAERPFYVLPLTFDGNGGGFSPGVVSLTTSLIPNV